LYRWVGILHKFVSLLKSTGELSGKPYRFIQWLWFGFAFNSPLITADPVRQRRHRVLQSSAAAWIIIIGARYVIRSPPYAHRSGVGIADTTLLRVHHDSSRFMPLFLATSAATSHVADVAAAVYRFRPVGWSII